MTDTHSALAPFVRQQTVLLTTFRRDGTPVGTLVGIAVVGDHASVPTWDTAWEPRRIRHNPQMEAAPATWRGKPTGPALRARARLRTGSEAVAAGRALARKHPLLHGLLVPLTHRLLRSTTVHLEVRPLVRSRARSVHL